MGRTKRIRQKRDKNSVAPSPTIHHDLYKFLSSYGWRNENHLTVSSFPSIGRGLLAKRNLSEHDLIIELPHQAMICYHTLESDDGFVNLFSIDELECAKSSVTFQSLLSLYLLYQSDKGESSKWLAYLRSLPDSFTNPYFCKKSELYFLPESILEKIVEQNEVIKKDFIELTKLIRPEFKENFTLEAFKWAFFVCNSRSVYLNGKCLEPLVDHLNFKELLSDSPDMALAPLLDLLNHSDDAITKSQLNHSETSIEKHSEKIKTGEIRLSYQLFTTKSIKKFDQIFINYGAFNNTKLLIEYGFIIPNNHIDFLEFTLDDINNYIKSHQILRTMMIPKHKYKFIRDHQLDEQMFIDQTDGLNHNFQAVLGILLVPQNLYNLTQVAFGDELKFSDIKQHATEIVRGKKMNFEKFCEGLEKQSDGLSRSGNACVEYFRESIKLIDKVLEFIENL